VLIGTFFRTILQVAGYGVLVAFASMGLYYVKRRIDEKRKAAMAERRVVGVEAMPPHVDRFSD